MFMHTKPVHRIELCNFGVQLVCRDSLPLTVALYVSMEIFCLIDNSQNLQVFKKNAYAGEMSLFLSIFVFISIVTYSLCFEYNQELHERNERALLFPKASTIGVS